MEQLLLHSESNYSESIMKKLLPDFYETLEIQEYASGRKVLVYNENDYIFPILEESPIMKHGENPDVILDETKFKNKSSVELYLLFRDIVTNKYGNFVFQTMFKNLPRAKNYISSSVLLYIKEVDPNLMTQYFGKKPIF